MLCKSVSGYCFNVGFMQDDSSNIEDTFFITENGCHTCRMFGNT